VDGLSEPSEIEVKHLFMPDRRAFVALLDELAPGDWKRPTVCAGWDVRDIALHVLGVDLANIAIRRDGVAYLRPAPREDFGRFIDRINGEWITAARRLTPTLIRDLLEFTARPLDNCMSAIDGSKIDANVSWASRQPVPGWLDLAREYMERWVHQQHIRDAVGRPGQDTPEFASPVIAASMFSLPIALEEQPPGSLAIEIGGSGGGTWVVKSQSDGWRLFRGNLANPTARLRIAAGDWWRTVTLGLSPSDALTKASVEGDSALARAALDANAIIA
jgi:uncharacterized protein (TIGR03083 family)